MPQQLTKTTNWEDKPRLMHRREFPSLGDAILGLPLLLFDPPAGPECWAWESINLRRRIGRGRRVQFQIIYAPKDDEHG